MSEKEEGTGAGPAGPASGLVASGALTSEWLPAYEAVPRENFVPDVIWPDKGRAVDRRSDPHAWREAVYSDVSLTTQWDDGTHTGPEPGDLPTSSSSQPTMVFSMLGALIVEDGHRVLEIGTGTGWNSALLSERLGSENVVTVEVDEDSAKAAQERLTAAGYAPTAVTGDGAEGYVPGSPYDRVMFTASVTEFPRHVIRQTRRGGIVVAPFAPEYGGGGLVRLVVGDDGTASGRFTGSAAFMRLRQQRSRRKHTHEYLGGADWPADGVRSTTALNPDDVGDWLPMFAIGLGTRGMFPWPENYADGSYTLWLRDAEVTSWATVDFEPGATEFEVYQSGPRNLWDELVRAYRWWERQGRPGFTRYGLTVTPDGAHTPWLDSPGQPVPALGPHP